MKWAGETFFSNIGTASDAATIELADGSKRSMTPRRLEEAPVGVTWPGGPSQERVTWR
jgi:hypothetical protein